MWPGIKREEWDLDYIKLSINVAIPVASRAYLLSPPPLLATPGDLAIQFKDRLIEILKIKINEDEKRHPFKRIFETTEGVAFIEDRKWVYVEFKGRAARLHYERILKVLELIEEYKYNYRLLRLDTCFNFWNEGSKYWTHDKLMVSPFRAIKEKERLAWPLGASAQARYRPVLIEKNSAPRNVYAQFSDKGNFEIVVYSITSKYKEAVRRLSLAKSARKIEIYKKRIEHFLSQYSDEQEVLRFECRFEKWEETVHILKLMKHKEYRSSKSIAEFAAKEFYKTHPIVYPDGAISDSFRAFFRDLLQSGEKQNVVSRKHKRKRKK